MRQTQRLIIAVCILFFALNGVLLVVYAESPTLELKVSPATIKIAPGDHQDVVVTVTNPLTETIHGLRLSWFSDVGVDIAFKASPASDLPPQATAAWQLDLSKKSDGTNAGTVSFRLDYSTTVANQNLPHVLLASLEIQPRPLDTMDKVATARVESAIERVEENQSGVLYLIVTNVSDVPITLKGVKLNRPNLVDVTEPPMASQPITLPTNVSAVYPYTVSVSITLPGKRLFLFETQLEWTRSGQTYAGTLSTPFSFSTDVFGSEILTAVGIPSLLLLPGILIVAFALFVITQSKVFSYTLDLKDFKFLVIAITVSLIVAVAYPFLGFFTKWFGLSPNFLQGYSLRDLIGLWLGSVLVGLGSGVIIALVMWIRREVQNRRLASRTPSEIDDALELLEKLARNNLGIAREQYQIARDNRTQNVFAVEKVKADQGEWWVAPSIIVKWKPAVAGLADERRNALKRQLAVALENFANVKALADLLRHKEEWLTVDFDRSGVIRTPTKVKSNEAKRLAGLRRIVEEK